MWAGDRVGGLLGGSFNTGGSGCLTGEAAVSQRRLGERGNGRQTCRVATSESGEVPGDKQLNSLFLQILKCEQPTLLLVQREHLWMSVPFIASEMQRILELEHLSQA